MKYQLIIQFDASSNEDFERLIDIETQIENALDNSHEVDGHDFGSSEMNIFIQTNNPTEAFTIIKDKLISGKTNNMKAAFREIEGETYNVIWPEQFTGEFTVA